MADKAKSTAVVKTVKQLVIGARDQIAQVLPAHMDPDQMIQGVRLALAQNPALEECNPKSVLFSVMAAARIGLELNSPLQHAWLIPYAKECTLQIGYRGYQELARRGGGIRNIEARAVYQGDDFSYELGSAPFVKHKPSGATDAKLLTHAYGVAFFPDSAGAPIIEVMTRSEIEAARKVSRFSDKPDSPWQKWYSEMARKTVVRRLAKYLPLSPEMGAAIEMDLRGETGKVQSTSTLIDTDVSLAAGMQEKTEEQLAELRERMAPPAKAEPSAPVAAQPSAPAAEQPPIGDSQPW